MKPIIKTALLLSALSASIISCDKKEDPKPTTTTPTDTTTKKGEVGIEIDNYAGTNEIALNTNYTTPAGDIMLTKFNYYVSNVKLKRADGAEFIEPESYHFVTADKKTSGHFHMKNVPAGSYSSVTFMIGVDSARNVSGAQTGALDVANGNFWTWSTGYIMGKIEGTSPQSGDPNKKVMLHVGGFKGEFSGLRTVTLTFAQPLNVTASSESSVKVKADMLKWFTPNNINFATDYTIMTVGTASKKLADNYANMFTLE
jgi:hypothetical protein